jgi:glycosyltransferase involved in cell wall biosynthesis
VGQSMRVMIDGSMCTAGGGFSFLANVVPQMALLAPENQFRILVRNPELAEAMPAIDNLEVEVLPHTGILGRMRFSYLEAPRLAKQWNADVYYSAGETVPLRSHCPSIASFQNPNVFSKKELHWPLYQKARLGLLRAIASVSARCAERVIFVSEDSASWMGDSVGLPEDRRAAIQHGIDVESFSQPADAPLHPNPYILSVSSIYRYKNYVRLIEAYTELAQRRSDMPDLIIIGDNQDQKYSEEMYRARDAAGAFCEKIHILGEVPYAQIAPYYAGASLFVFPSYLETFGIPLLEAMGSGLPTVAADTPIFREVGGEAVLYADPYSSSALAKSMEQALFSPGFAGALEKLGRERARHFTWERTASKLLAVLDEVHAEQTARALPERRPQLAFQQSMALSK